MTTSLKPADPASPARVRIARRRLFSSGHLYHQKQFSSAENQAHFGRCFTEHGHGHNYILEVYLEGPIDAGTGLVMNLTDVDQILFDVVDPLDHQHLNFDLAAFGDLVPTTENIALYLRGQVLDRLKKFPAVQLAKLRLYETDDLWVEIQG